MIHFSIKTGGVIAGMLLILLVGAMIWAQPKTLPQASDVPGALQLVTTIYPLAEFAEQVGGDLVKVTALVPAGVEPHDYEPTPQDIAQLYNADVVLVNGNGVDAWAEKLGDDLRKKGVHTVQMSEELASSSSTDPHYWLDPVLAKQLVQVIHRAVEAKHGPSEVLGQQVNAAEARLDALHTRYEVTLARCARRGFVTTHDAFRYLASRYHLVQYPISGFSPTEDPSPQTMAEISNLVREKGITTIFTETLVSPKTAEAIASETGAITAVLNPIEGITEVERQAGKGYIQLMEDNLTQLNAALQCS